MRARGLAHRESGGGTLMTPIRFICAPWELRSWDHNNYPGHLSLGQSELPIILRTRGGTSKCAGVEMDSGPGQIPV